MNDLINTIVGGRYYVLDRIGQGGFSAVFKVKDISNKKFFAMKQYVSSDPANTKILMEGMERELNVLKNCTHPNLPKIYNLIKEDEKFFLIMEYVEGVNLKQYIETKGTLNKKMLISVMNQVCSGLYYLHSMIPPVVYRDLKPSNIIFMDNAKIKLIDFGIAKRYSHEIIADDFALGSRGFAAPEQFGTRTGHGLFNTDIRSDIYGAGTTMYFLATGKIYDGNISFWRVRGKIRRIIRRCTKINPKDRYQNMIELLCALSK